MKRRRTRRRMTTTVMILVPLKRLTKCVRPHAAFEACWWHSQQVLSSSWDGRTFGHSRHGPKWGGLLCPFHWRAESPSNTMLPWPRPNSVPNWQLHPSSRLATTDMGQKLGACAPFLGVKLGAHLRMLLGRGLPACQVSFWSIQPFGHNAPTLQTYRTGQDNRPIA